MKLALVALLLVYSSAALSKESCYRRADLPTWTVIVSDRHSDPEAPEMIWNQDGVLIELAGLSAGPGIDQRVMVDGEGRDYQYAFSDDTLILDHKTYRRGCDR